MGIGPVLVLVVLGALVNGLVEGANVPTVQELVAGAAPNESRGAVTAVWVGFARLGQTLGPILAGVAVTAFGFTTTYVLGAILAVGLSVATLVFASVMRRGATGSV